MNKQSNNKWKTKNQKGITLVALVITIIIIIILATVTINMAFGDNGLIKQAQLAKDMASNSTIAEQEEMNKVMEEYANLMTEDSEINNYYFDVVLDKTEIVSLPDTITITTKNYEGENFTYKDLEYDIQINSDYETTISDGKTSRVLEGGKKNEETFKIDISEKEDTNNFKIEIVFNVKKPYTETLKKEIIYKKQIRFNYTGTEQSFNVQTPGRYQIELYGASGGNSNFPGNSLYEAVTKYGGKGGYSKGDIYLTEGTTLYFYVGGAGGPYNENDTETDEGGWNGGGTLTKGQSAYGAPGGRSNRC